MAGPNIDLDWEQALFRAARSVWRVLVPSRPEPVSEAAAHLAERAGTLSVLARVLGGDRMRVSAAAGVGGIRGSDLLLPACVDLCDDPGDNAAIYTYRAVVGALLADAGVTSDTLLDHMRHCAEVVAAAAASLPHLEALHTRCLALELEHRPPPPPRGVGAVQERAICSALSGETPWDDPGLRAAFAVPLATSGVWVWGRPIELAFTGTEGAHPGEAPPAADSSEVEAMAVEDLRLLDLSEEDQAELPVHVFEKVETLDNWSGGVRPMDGSDELDDHLEALDEVDLRDLIRGGEQVHSVMRADLALDLEIPDVARISPTERGITYPEWNHRKGCYRPDWTTVYPTAVPRGPDTWAADATQRWRRQIDDLRMKLRVLQDALRPQPRQLDGEDIDIDACVTEMCARRAGHGGDRRLYQRLHRKSWDLATTVLLDLSLSSDGWVDGRRVLDVARESVLVLGEVLKDFAPELRIMAFASQTRNQVRAWDVLGWDDSWAAARGRLGLLHPQGYTRIGPALRHATADLRPRTARRKLLILLSDGRPTDYDRYEGRYGISDVRRAVADARSEGVRVHALAIDSQARDVLPAMLGRGCWDLLPSPSLLPEVLTTLTARMAAT